MKDAFVGYWHLSLRRSRSDFSPDRERFHQALPMVTVAELRARSVWHDQRSELDVDARAASPCSMPGRSRIDPSRMMPGTGAARSPRQSNSRHIG